MQFSSLRLPSPISCGANEHPLLVLDRFGHIGLWNSRGACRRDTQPVVPDNAVLQQGMKVPVWGAADPGERVTVEFAGQTVSATASADCK